MKPLQEILEERLGARPRLEFRVAGEDGAATGAPTGGVPPPLPQPPWDVPEATSEAEPEPEAQRREDAVSGSVSGPKAGSTGEEVGGADDVIQDPQEVFAMARERLGPGRKQNRGS